jgi:hypothetical protein
MIGTFACAGVAQAIIAMKSKIALADII